MSEEQEPDRDVPGLPLVEPTAAPGAPGAYRVLARKYRPQTFDELIGQDALVQTLTNAFATGRVAHAFILTGVRGVGKTTTARIIAKGLNCTGEDGAGGATIKPCGVCDNCRAIVEDRHVDVMEMDAASHTSVDNIREILEGVRYRPVMGRTKVYIIDEVHMLSKSAFNALLKTLEEPPPHVTFILATTETRKVPVTVLSRCQRFDLRRIEADRLIEHLRAIARREAVEPHEEALRLIARAADGSARDGLSLLDQAIALGGGAIEAEPVRDMLGLADAAQIYDLLDAALRGDPPAALDLLGVLYAAGAEPVIVLQDLLALVHWLTRLVLVPDAADGATVQELERSRGREMAGRLSVPLLGRAWQILLKGLNEVQYAPSPIGAAEMVLIRLCFTADMPPPEELIKQLKVSGTGGPPPASKSSAARKTVAPPAAPSSGAPSSFRELVDLFAERRELRLRNELYHHVHPVRFEPGVVEIRLTADAPRDLARTVRARLSAWLGADWQVIASEQAGEPTLVEQDHQAVQSRTDAASAHPVVRAALETFPGAEIVRVSPRAAGGLPNITPTEATAHEES